MFCERVVKKWFMGFVNSASSVSEVFSATATYGKKYKTKQYNLDAFICLDYGVNSGKSYPV
jgi:hypothetical protein